MYLQECSMNPSKEIKHLTFKKCNKSSSAYWGKGHLNGGKNSMKVLGGQNMLWMMWGASKPVYSRYTLI